MKASDYGFFDAPFLPFAHRGGSLLPTNVGQENTLDAFQHAVDLGYRYLETDIHATADGHLVAFHDDTLDRVSDRRGRIADLPLREVRAAVVGNGGQVPLLSELFEAFPDARFNIDIKEPSAVEPLVREINFSRVHDRVCVASFGADRLHAFRRRMGIQVPTAASSRGVAFTALVPLLPRLISGGGVALQLPVSYRIGGQEVDLVTPKVIAAAHARGKEVHVWTIDDPAEMIRLIDLGVDGIITDRPDVLKEVLMPRGLWPDEGHRASWETGADPDA